MDSLRFRQVHLDFHTSPLIPHIGKDFSPKQFVDALKEGYVDSVTVFSKCHHGYAYHPTKVHEVHPHLEFDLLSAQLEALRGENIAAPVYISAGLDEKEAVRHPEWLVRNKDETTTWVPDFTTQAGYHLLCYNTGYLELLVAQIEEVMEVYQPQGIFLDISSVHPCYCSSCRQDILAKGKSLDDMDAVMEQAEAVYKEYCLRTRAAVDKYNPEASLFHNSGHISRGRRDLAGYNSHLELESLPTGGWGYDHFPMSASYCHNLGQDYLGMTGKFHTSWGEFGGFKHPNALIYETSLSLAFGAKSSIGDQLHPLGKMDLSTYKLIGKAYREVAEKEPWCKDTKLLADIGILSSEACAGKAADKDLHNYSDIGANRMMLEGKYLYHIVDKEADFSAYALIILPDNILLDQVLCNKLKQFAQQGGKLLATGKSGLDLNQERFVLDFGVEYMGPNHNCPNYFCPTFPTTNGTGAYVMYEPSYSVTNLKANVLGFMEDSYFNRTPYQFCSHQHTPNNPNTVRPGLFVYGDIAYCPWEIFADYGIKGSLHLKEIIVYLIDVLLGQEKTIATNLPDKGIVTLQEQTKESRLIIHLLFAHTSLRGKNIEVVEDLVTLRNIQIRLQLAKRPSKVYLAPSQEVLEYNYEEGELMCVVPSMTGHQMVVVER